MDLQNNVLQMLCGPLGDSGNVTAADIARAQVVGVANITSPTELGSIVGSVEGELRLAVQIVGGGNNFMTLYQWDIAGAVANSPYVVASTGGSWVAVSGRYSGVSSFSGPSGQRCRFIGNSDSAIVGLDRLGGSNATVYLGCVGDRDTTNLFDTFQVYSSALSKRFEFSIPDSGNLSILLGGSGASGLTIGNILTTWTGLILAGVQTGLAAIAGQVGEVISSTVTAAAVAATGTVGNVTSISLTRGDWLISGFVNIAGGATGLTAGSTAKASIVTTTATNGVNGSTMAQSSVEALVANGLKHMAIPQVRVNISATTTYFLTEVVTYAAGSPTAAGIIIATRMR